MYFIIYKVFDHIYFKGYNLNKHGLRPNSLSAKKICVPLRVHWTMDNLRKNSEMIENTKLASNKEMKNYKIKCNTSSDESHSKGVVNTDHSRYALAYRPLFHRLPLPRTVLLMFVQIFLHSNPWCSPWPSWAPTPLLWIFFAGLVY